MSEQETDFLDDIAIGGVEQEPPAAPESAAKPEAEKVEKQPEPAKAEPAAPTAPEVKDETTVPLAALMAEREKRQQLQRELEQSRQQRPPQTTQEAAPNFYENPDAFVQTIEQRANNRLYAALEAQARESYADYDEVFAEVEAHVATNPAAAQQVLSAPNPALAAYKLGKQLREMKQMEDPVAYRERLKAELRAELEAEQKAKDEARQKAADAVPPDLTDTRNAKGQFAPKAGDIFNDIFPE